MEKQAQPENGDEQVDQHDGCHQNVDKEQCNYEPGTFRTTRNIQVGAVA